MIAIYKINCNLTLKCQLISNKKDGLKPILCIKSKNILVISSTYQNMIIKNCQIAKYLPMNYQYQHFDDFMFITAS
ncbi:hypothetical protein A6769_07605 [Nostoc punctiforme NIES-2108]|uniref:Uncharacterized protein n=1 Tax=Nostoc punctiforme NIES-2108 TaxID=1356359 RepID=A0A367RQQ7_NOSPU|nr:hypothetical protein A6769_07605 [Nostoc punctiforme NIES-2108]